jgi:spore germination protein
VKIHVVAVGDTLISIAAQYGTTADQIVQVNELPNPNDLVVGQSLAIRIPEVTHTVVEGDTLTSIAEKYDITVTKLLQNNPQLAVTNIPTTGETLVIRFRDESAIDDIVLNGYAYPFIDRTTLRKSLPFLTHLLIFNYGFTPEGDLVPTDDEELIAIAKEYNVGPIMVLAPMTAEGEFNSQIAHDLFVNDVAEDRLIENIATTLQAKGYLGVDIDFEFILPEDKEQFLSFVTKMQARLSRDGLLTFIALAPKTSGEMVGLLYQAHDYPTLGAVADEVLLMTYEWGYTYGPPMATAPVNNVRKVLEYGVSVIDPGKILMGIPNYAYDWPLPFVRGQTRAESIGNQDAISRAAQYNVNILFDDLAQAPHYFYTDANSIRHTVWFDDVRSFEAKMRLIPELNLNGGGIWQIMRYSPALWNVVGSLFNVRKV